MNQKVQVEVVLMELIMEKGVEGFVIGLLKMETYIGIIFNEMLTH